MRRPKKIATKEFLAEAVSLFREALEPFGPLVTWNRRVRALSRAVKTGKVR